MKVDGAALVLNRKRANNIKFVSFFSELGRDIWQFLYANQLLCRESFYLFALAVCCQTGGANLCCVQFSPYPTKGYLSSSAVAIPHLYQRYVQPLCITSMPPSTGLLSLSIADARTSLSFHRPHM